MGSEAYVPRITDPFSLDQFREVIAGLQTEGRRGMLIVEDDLRTLSIMAHMLKHPQFEAANGIKPDAIFALTSGEMQPDITSYGASLSPMNFVYVPAAVDSVNLLADGVASLGNNASVIMDIEIPGLYPDGIDDKPYTGNDLALAILQRAARGNLPHIIFSSNRYSALELEQRARTIARGQFRDFPNNVAIAGKDSGEMVSLFLEGGIARLSGYSLAAA